jgi:Ser-tRNA(Ala) deacylase AlaX
MTEQLFMCDAYLRECTAQVLDVGASGKQQTIFLDQTVLQPSHRDGGDRGEIVLENGTSLPIGTVVLESEGRRIEHRTKVRDAVRVGGRAQCRVDWMSRYTLMRKHTANHILYGCAKALLKAAFPALSKTTLGDTYTCWIGQSARASDDLIAAVVEMSNALIGEDRPVIIETLPRAAALQKCGQYHEAILPKFAEELRVVTIDGLDSDPCRGLHVQQIGEVERVVLARVERDGNDVKVFSMLGEVGGN